MPDTSPKLLLPLLQPSQAQKHVTHNEALQHLDTMVQLTVESFGSTTPPALPINGETYALGLAPTGVWAGQDSKIATYRENAWAFIDPQEGWRAWGKTEESLRSYFSGSWSDIPVDFQNLDGVGINATSDGVNRLAVSSDATLLSHDGSNHQVKVNKAATGDTASLLLQTGWSGRAEMGLTGDDDFHVKVSDDGSSFTEALKIYKSTGLTQAKGLMSGQITIADDSVGSIDTPSAGGFVLIVVTGSDYPQVDHSGIFIYDTGPSRLNLEVFTGPKMENNNLTAQTGTTSTDGYSGFSVQPNQLQIENRYGSTRVYTYTFLGGY